jgi:PAS domain S-box-containing protein
MSDGAGSPEPAFWGDAAGADDTDRDRTLVSTVDDGVYQLDADGTFVAVNDGIVETTGYAREELVGAHAAVLFDEAGVERIERETARLRSNDGARGELLELPVETASGERIYVEVRPSLVEGDGGVGGTVGLVRDITDRKRRERELEESERRYRTLAENFPNGAVGLVDHDLRYVTVGGTPLTEHAVDTGEMEGRHVREVVSEEVADRLVPRLRAALDGESSTVEYSYEDGERHARFRTFPLRGDDGEVLGAMGMSQDITEQVERKRRLEESERLYRTLAQNFPDGAVGIYDDDLRFDLVEGAMWEDIEPDTEDVQGNTIYEAFEDHVVANIEPIYRAALSEGVTDSVVTEYAGRILRVWATPLRGSGGEIFAGLSFAQDITEQVEREAELERALDLLERTQRIADVGGWEIDMRTGEVFWTDHTFELLDMHSDTEPSLEEVLEMYHEDDRADVAAALESGEPFDMEKRIRTASGEVRWVRLRGIPEVVGGEVTSIRGAAQDVTEKVGREQRLEELVEKLEDSNERLEQFAYAASHDLQEPLRMVSSYLQLIEDRYGDELDADGEEFLAFAVDGADRMRDMIDALLDYSRVETRGDPFEPVALGEVLADVRRDLRIKIEESNADITAGSLPTVYGDRDQLYQLLQNLLTNALEYSGDEPPRIHVSAEEEGGDWRVSVRDEGIGIDPEDTDRVFDIFQSLHPHDEHSGTGIGLALAERIVERHGGTIRVDAEPGKGSTFSFTLPATGDGDE